MTAHQIHEVPIPRSGITFADKALIDVGTAALIIDLIEHAAALSARLKLPKLRPQVTAVQRDLEQFLTYASAYANVSTEVVRTHDVLLSDRDVVTVQAAAAELGIKPAGVRWACRNKRLGRKVGGRWLINREDVEMYKLNRSDGVA